MANSGYDSNKSQFFITFDKSSWLDGRHVVFGEIIEGRRLIKQIEKLGTSSGKPKKEVKISDCGVLEY